MDDTNDMSDTIDILVISGVILDSRARTPRTLEENDSGSIGVLSLARGLAFTSTSSRDAVRDGSVRVDSTSETDSKSDTDSKSTDSDSTDSNDPECDSSNDSRGEEGGVIEEEGTHRETSSTHSHLDKSEHCSEDPEPNTSHVSEANECGRGLSCNIPRG